MEPWQSWTVVGVAGAGMYWYYTRQQTNKRHTGRNALSAEQAQSSRRRVDRNVPASSPSSGTDQAQKRKGAKKGSNGTTKNSNVDTVNEITRPVDAENGDVEEIDNKEFARQLAGAKAGTSLVSPAKIDKPKKTQRLGKAGKIPRTDMSSAPADKAMSATSSTTGIDADDDLSQPDSPSLPPQSSLNQGGVSDMLEAPTRGPSVLRVTESMEPQRSNQPKPSKSSQPQETKKQRQRKQKNEAQKLEREQAEKERRVLLEKQLRTAREAEGRPAKNGVPVSKPPTISAWANPTKDSSAIKPTSNVTLNDNGALLDTFEDNALQEVSQSSGHRTNGTSTAKNGAWDHELPSEEEQIRILTELEDDGGWQTVEKPKKREKSTNNPNDESLTTKRNIHPKAEKDDDDSTKEDGYKNGRYIPYAETGHPEDSDWRVA